MNMQKITAKLLINEVKKRVKAKEVKLQEDVTNKQKN